MQERKPRLLLVITLAEIGGAQSYVVLLLPALARRFDLTVAAYGPGPVQDAALAAGIPYVSLRHVRRPLSLRRDPLGLLELIRLCRRVRPDILHANSSKAGILGRLAAALTGVPIRIFTAHGWAFAAYSGLASKLYLWSDRLMKPLTTAIVCVAENELREGLRAGTCRRERTVVIHNAVDAAALPQSQLSGSPPRVVSAGRLKAPKDFVTLVRALALLEPGSFRALVAGDGPDRPAVEDEIAHRGLGEAIELAGDRSDVPELLAGADVFVLATRSEGLPMSVLEAMAAGLPVAASAVGGVPELVIDGETGLLVPPGDPEKLGAALRRLLEDADLRRRFGASGRRRVEQVFDVGSFRDRHVELYRAELAARSLPLPGETTER